MIIIRLKDSKNIEAKLKTILDDAMLRGEIHIILLTESTFHEDVHNKLNKHVKIGRVVVGGKSLFCIKEMRIELEQITFSI